MPFIRYKIEDYGILSSPRNQDNANAEQVLEAVNGRTNSVLWAQNGTLVHPGYIVSMICDRKWIKKFQVIQKSYTKCVYKIVKSDLDYAPGELDEIKTKTKLALGDECEVDIDFVENIAPSSSGKFQNVICELKV